MFQLTLTVLEKRKDILPPGGKCLCSARKMKGIIELGTDGSILRGFSKNLKGLMVTVSENWKARRKLLQEAGKRVTHLIK